MSPFAGFPITHRWPPKHPDRLQLCGAATPNGVKVSIALEEIGWLYEAHRIDISANETWTEEFLSFNPNGKIPAILDPDGPGGAPFAIFLSAAVLLYLAEKSGKLLPSTAALRSETVQWLFWQMAAVGPMFGQLGYFHKFGGRDIADKRPFERYCAETTRLPKVLDQRLSGRHWIMRDDYTIADIACIGPVHNLIGFYGAREVVDYDRPDHVPSWLNRALARPGVVRGLAAF